MFNALFTTAQSTSQPNIVSPNGHDVYGSTVLLTVDSVDFGSEMDSLIQIFYSLDGHANISVISKEMDVVAKKATLAGLSTGRHSIVVFAERDFPFWSRGEEANFSSSTVYFTVDATAPAISNLNIENKTYSAKDISLEFSVDDPSSSIFYSLDGQANVTTTGNITLKGLSYGAHTLNVYANDTNGNVGKSETIRFIVAEGHFPITVVIAVSAAVTAAIGAGLIVYFKKRQ